MGRVWLHYGKLLIGGLLGILCIRVIFDIFNKYTCQSIRLFSIDTIRDLHYLSPLVKVLLLRVKGVALHWRHLGNTKKIVLFFGISLDLHYFSPLVKVLSFENKKKN
jgi:hypothetical protein